MQHKRLTIQLTPDQHAAMTMKIDNANFPTIAEFFRAAVTEWNPRKRKVIKAVATTEKKKVAKKTAKKVKKVTKKAVKKVTKKTVKK